MRQHRDNPVNQIDARSPFQRLFIDSGMFRNIMAHIRNMHAELISIRFFCQCDRIIQIFGIFSVDRYGLPIPNIRFLGPGASRAVVVEGDSTQVSFGNLSKVLEQPDTQIRLFGKPEVHDHRRMGVLLARAESTNEARRKTKNMLDNLEITL